MKGNKLAPGEFQAQIGNKEMDQNTKNTRSPPSNHHCLVVVDAAPVTLQLAIQCVDFCSQHMGQNGIQIGYGIYCMYIHG